MIVIYILMSYHMINIYRDGQMSHNEPVTPCRQEYPIRNEGMEEDFVRKKERKEVTRIFLKYPKKEYWIHTLT